MADDPIGTENDEQFGEGVCPACRGTDEIDGVTCGGCNCTGKLVEGVGS